MIDMSRSIFVDAVMRPGVGLSALIFLMEALISASLRRMKMILYLPAGMTEQPKFRSLISLPLKSSP